MAHEHAPDIDATKTGTNLPSSIRSWVCFGTGLVLMHVHTLLEHII